MQTSTATQPSKPQPLSRRVLTQPTVAEVAETRQDTVAKMAVDALKHRAEASGHKGLNGTLKVVNGLQKGQAGDTYSAASSMASAMEKLTPVLSKSPLGVTTSAVVLLHGDDQLIKHHQKLTESVQKVADPRTDHPERTKAALDAALGVTQLASVARNMGKAVGNIWHFGARTLSKFSPLAPAVAKAEGLVAKVAGTKLGATLGFLNKWIPLLNVVWVVTSAKTAIDVHRDPASSGASKALAATAVGTSAAVVAAGLTLSPWGFFGVTAGSILVDLALAYSRQQDKQAA